MKRRIFWSVFLASMASLLVFGGCIVGIAYYSNLQDGWNNLTEKAYYLSVALGDSDSDYLAEVRGYSGRITLIDQDGTVVFDDKEPVGNMENHAQRPEVMEAQKTGTGKVIRASDTLREQTLYYALRLKDGRVLRVSQTTASVFGQTSRLFPLLLLVLALSALVSGGIARIQTKAIIKPMNKINLDTPLEAEAYEELSPLLRRIEDQRLLIQKQIEDLKIKQKEFALITKNMDEGLVVVNQEGIVLSLNQRAKDILNIQIEDPTEKHILALSRNIDLEKAIQEAVQGEKVSESIEFKGRKYQLTASRSVANNQVQGVVLLLQDVTEGMLAEQQRREFSANVSHELKTPLTSISGYAELLQNGLVKPEDVQDFAGRIYEEANRMITLVDDIIRLSHLDEKAGGLEYATVNLGELAKRTIQDLAPKAEKKGIEIRLESQPFTITSVPSVLNEILYNLLDNAIRYSQLGPITVSVMKNRNKAEIVVGDKGVGIAPEDIEHIFERFYRVDKSHSRGSGGTGLGLAIVKRGALFLGGTVTLETVVLLSQQKPSDHIKVDLDLDELDATSAETKSTYAEIKEYVLKENGLKVSNLYISQVKRKYGLEVGENYNLAKSEDAKQPNCPEDKERAIADALKHFGMVI